MGGLAFANLSTGSGEPVDTPRMSPDLYKAISAQCQAKLETLFERIVIPRDAPAKANYGDIDFLVGAARQPVATSELWVATKKALEADLYLPRGESSSYAVPHPEIPGAHVQVDVELSPGDGTPDGAELFEWTRFMKGDSDLLQIIGISHRSLGLICNDQGLNIRVEEMEPYNKKKALLFLTRDPNKTMEFYGLDVAKFWAGFTDENDLFDWASSGRFFSHVIFERRVEKSNDRSRQAKRPMYQRFVKEYMLEHPEKGDTNTWTRQQVLQEALTVFDKQMEYDSMMEGHRVKEAEEKLWKDIRAAVPVQSNSLALIMKGLRRWVDFEEEHPRITPEPNLGEPLIWSNFVSADNRDGVLEWVEENWEEVKALEKARTSAAKKAGKTTSSDPTLFVRLS
ncbi:hypothetical protein EJ02DRAFT_455359 [Clathrospora elynae]|uniref:Uncharacterized protein n=1 Tax=Clathrospora elynae TaxID=706981 RepID=A0A6A5SKM6_9PLEO|nr:hypothetical protein EJ02DRAFT_455359 [Clathrospora elynae]